MRLKQSSPRGSSRPRARSATQRSKSCGPSTRRESTRATDKIRRTQDSVAKEEQQASQQKLQTAVSFGATLLGAVLGRKAVSMSTLGRATTAARGVSRSMKEAGDIAQAQERQREAEAELKEIEAELEREVQELQDGRAGRLDRDDRDQAEEGGGGCAAGGASVEALVVTAHSAISPTRPN